MSRWGNQKNWCEKGTCEKRDLIPLLNAVTAALKAAAPYVPVEIQGEVIHALNLAASAATPGLAPVNTGQRRTVTDGRKAKTAARSNAYRT